MALLEAGLEESVQGGQKVRFIDPLTGKLRGSLHVPVPRAPILISREEDPGPVREVLAVNYLDAPHNVLITASNSKFLYAWDVDSGRQCKKIFVNDKEGNAMTMAHLVVDKAADAYSMFLIELETGKIYRLSCEAGDGKCSDAGATYP